MVSKFIQWTLLLARLGSLVNHLLVQMDSLNERMDLLEEEIEDDSPGTCLIIPVPVGFSVEQIWELVKRGDPIIEDEDTAHAMVAVSHDGHLLHVIGFCEPEDE